MNKIIKLNDVYDNFCLINVKDIKHVTTILGENNSLVVFRDTSRLAVRLPVEKIYDLIYDKNTNI